MPTTPSDQWDQHILVVFSVLAGLSLDKTFDVLVSSGFRLAYIILSIAVFYIILDNWYFLHKDLRVIEIDKPLEVIFYMISIIFYSCLPFLYIIKSFNPLPPLEPPDWMLVNLLLICLIDALRKMITLSKMRSNPSKYINTADRKLVGAYVFYTLSGFFYTFLLFIFIWVSISLPLSVVIKSLIVVGIWAIIRSIDMAVIPRVAELIARIFLEEHKIVGPTHQEQ